MKMILMITALLSLSTGCTLARQSPPDWRDYVTPGPDGLNISEVVSVKNTANNSKTYALRFARQACDEEGKKLTVHSVESEYIGPDSNSKLIASVANAAAKIYAADHGTRYYPGQPVQWRTTTAFTCD